MVLAADRLDRWLRLPKTSAAYGLDYRGDYPGIVARHRTFLADAVALADPTVDFRTYSTVLIVAGGGGCRARAGVPLSAGTGVVADGNELRGMVVMSAPLATHPDLVHEAGHLFGLPDNYDFSLPFAEGTRQPRPLGPHEQHRFAVAFPRLGEVEARAGSTLRSFAVRHRRACWRRRSSPIEMPGGVKMIVLPTSATTAEVVEVHTLRGNSDQVCDSGVIVYTVDVQARSGTVGARIKPARDEPRGAQCGSIPRAAFDLGPGEMATHEDSADEARAARERRELIPGTRDEEVVEGWVV